MSSFYVFAIVLTVLYILYYVVCVVYDLYYKPKETKNKSDVEEFHVGEDEAETEESPKEVIEDPSGSYAIVGASQSEDMENTPSPFSSTLNKVNEVEYDTPDMVYEQLKKAQNNLPLVERKYEEEVDPATLMVMLAQPQTTHDKIHKEILSV